MQNAKATSPLKSMPLRLHGRCALEALRARGVALHSIERVKSVLIV